jgi:hypothetical protein
MKSTAAIFASILVAGCSTAPKENYQQAYESSLADGRVTMTTLRALDNGDIRTARQVAMTSLHVTLSLLPSIAAKAHPAPEEKQEELALARDVLNYMVAHREDFDPRLPSVKAGMRGLREILIAPDDARQVRELSDYFAGVEKAPTENTKQ